MATPTIHARAYRSQYGLPPLAGLATFEEAVAPGLPVDQCVARLKRFHYCFKRLHQIFIGRLTAEPIYELKMSFGLHAYYCAEHVAALRSRIGEMREPPLGLDTVPHAALEMFFDEILCAPSTEELVLGVYLKALPALREAVQQFSTESHPLADAPSIRVCRFASLELDDMIAYGNSVAETLVPSDRTTDTRQWLDLLDVALLVAGGVEGPAKMSEATLTRHFSNKPFRYDKEPHRDKRFSDPYNMGVNAEAFLYDTTMPAEPKVLMMFYKRLREIDVPEMMASIIFETQGKPWGYYRDMTRQLYDEARHAMMGEVGFVSLGLDWPTLVMVNSTWSRMLNTQLSAKERHAVLYYIEQGLMPKTGKRHEWEVAVRAKNALASTFQDFDWADEVLHARVGREWYVADMPGASEAVAFGDECWSRILVDWEAWKNRGLTRHRNWWPDLYSAYCQIMGTEPDPNALEFSTTYEAQRPDLKSISPSG